jgi:hypothetical protein
VRPIVDGLLSRELPDWFHRDPRRALAILAHPRGEAAAGILMELWRAASRRVGQSVPPGRLGPIPGAPEHHAWQALEPMGSRSLGPWQLAAIRMPAPREVGETAFAALTHRHGDAHMWSWRLGPHGGAELLKHVVSASGSGQPTVVGSHEARDASSFLRAVGVELGLSGEPLEQLGRDGQAWRTAVDEFDQARAMLPGGPSESASGSDLDPVGARGAYVSLQLLGFVPVLSFLPLITTYLAWRDGGPWIGLAAVLWLLLGAGTLASRSGFTYQPRSGRLTTWKGLNVPALSRSVTLLPGDLVEVAAIRVKGGHGFVLLAPSGERLAHTPVRSQMVDMVEALSSAGVTVERG